MIYICLLIASFAKASAMPFHTWIPDAAKDVPVPIIALLPASLDKLLGIYLLKKLDHSVFKKELMLILYSDDKYRLKEAEMTLQNLPIFKIE